MENLSVTYVTYVGRTDMIGNVEREGVPGNVSLKIFFMFESCQMSFCLPLSHNLK